MFLRGCYLFLFSYAKIVIFNDIRKYLGNYFAPLSGVYFTNVNQRMGL